MSIKPRAGRIKSLNTIMSDNTSILGHILNKATYLKQIEAVLHTLLPEMLRSTFRVANYQDKKLLLFTTNASNLTRMRFLEAQLLYNLQQHLPELKSFEVKVRPLPPKAKKKPVTKLTISKKSQIRLKMLAEEINDPRLKAVLLRLSNKSTTENNY